MRDIWCLKCFAYLALENTFQRFWHKMSKNVATYRYNRLSVNVLIMIVFSLFCSSRLLGNLIHVCKASQFIFIMRANNDVWQKPCRTTILQLQCIWSAGINQTNSERFIRLLTLIDRGGRQTTCNSVQSRYELCDIAIEKTIKKARDVWRAQCLQKLIVCVIRPYKYLSITVWPNSAVWSAGQVK